MFDQRKQFKFITKCDRIITNCDSLVYYKVRWTVITNCDSFFITKCDTVYYKLRQVLQSAIELLQIATAQFITKGDGQLLQIACDSFFVTKCDTVYYKLRQVLQSARHFTNCDGSPPISKSGSSAVVNRG